MSFSLTLHLTNSMLELCLKNGGCSWNRVRMRLG